MSYTQNEYVKLNRRILSWRWFSDTCTRDVFIYCILKANWKPGCWKNIEYGRGEFVTSISTMMKELGFSAKNIRTALEHLKSTGEITDRITHKYRVIRVCNYDKYQSSPGAEQAAGSQRRENAEIPTLSGGEFHSTGNIGGNMPAGCFGADGTFIFKKSEKTAACPATCEESPNAEVPTVSGCENKTSGRINGSLAARYRQDSGRMPAADKEDNKIRTKEEKNKYIKPIIDYLNKKTGACYRAESKNTASYIRARLNEGYNPEDFYKVIDKKCADWMNDKKMREYLRPSTLFGTKFESYLNSAGLRIDRSEPGTYSGKDDVDDFYEKYGGVS